MQGMLKRLKKMKIPVIKNNNSHAAAQNRISSLKFRSGIGLNAGQRKIILSILLICFFAASAARSDTVTLQSGETLKNVKVKMEKNGVMVKFPDGKIKKYDHSQIKSTEFSNTDPGETKEPSAFRSEENKKTDEGNLYLPENNENSSSDASEFSQSGTVKSENENNLSVKEQFIKDKNDAAARTRDNLKKSKEKSNSTFQKTKRNFMQFYLDTQQALGMKVKKAGTKIETKGEKISKSAENKKKDREKEKNSNISSSNKN